jgi:hypothetical protein
MDVLPILRLAQNVLPLLQFYCVSCECLVFLSLVCMEYINTHTHTHTHKYEFYFYCSTPSKYTYDK